MQKSAIKTSPSEIKGETKCYLKPTMALLEIEGKNQLLAEQENQYEASNSGSVAPTFKQPNVVK